MTVVTSDFVVNFKKKLGNLFSLIIKAYSVQSVLIS